MSIVWLWSFPFFLFFFKSTKKFWLSWHEIQKKKKKQHQDKNPQETKFFTTFRAIHDRQMLCSKFILFF
jgi:hypothetical protein